LAVERGSDQINMLLQQMDALAKRAAPLREHLSPEDVLADLGRYVDQVRLACALEIDAHRTDALNVGGWLADAADRAVNIVIRLAKAQLGLDDDFPFAAVALGKHGSREMGLVSDLDLVFVLACDDPAAAAAEGKTKREWAQRLGRRVIQYLSTQPPFGAGYELDSRLRPSGKKGVLVTALKHFRAYQLGEAQTWKHQALCRARVVAAPGTVRRDVEAVLWEVIAMPRDPQRLAAEVKAMRQKMLGHLAAHGPQVINLKHDAGGLVDIEFLAQYARLAFGGESTGTVAGLRGLPSNVPHAWRKSAGFLADTYLIYRGMENALRVELWRSIGHLPANPDASEWETMRRHTLIHDPDALRAKMHEVRSRFLELLGVCPDL